MKLSCGHAWSHGEEIDCQGTIQCRYCKRIHHHKKGDLVFPKIPVKSFPPFAKPDVVSIILDRLHYENIISRLEAYQDSEQNTKTQGLIDLIKELLAYKI